MPSNIDRDEVQRLTDQEGGQLIEVLPPREYSETHLPGAVNIPLKQLDADQVQSLDRSRPVIVYCHDAQ